MHYQWQIEQFLAKAKNPVQLALHYDKLSKKAREGLQWPCWLQVKYDGVYCMAIRDYDGVVDFYSRTGKKFFIGADLYTKLNQATPAGTGVYIAELCNDSISLERLSGYVNPNRKVAWEAPDVVAMNKSYLAFHDCISLEALYNGVDNTPYAERYGKLESRFYSNQPTTHSRIIPMELCYTSHEMQQFAAGMIEQDEEGIVRKESHAPWIAGHKGANTTKIVRGIDVDLLCTGVVIGEGKFEGLIAGLKFLWKGKEFTAGLGKGWDMDTQYVHTMAWQEDEFNVVNRVWRVTALQESSQGVLRLPKVGELRIDKVQADA